MVNSFSVQGYPEFTITGLQPNTNYSVKMSGKAEDSQLWKESDWYVYITTLDVARITNSNINFDVDVGLAITYNNPSGKDIDLYLQSPSGTNRVIRESYVSGTPLNLTTEEKILCLVYHLTQIRLG